MAEKPLDRLIDTPDKLMQEIRQFSQFVKSLSLSLPKQGRRILNQSNLQKNRTFMMSFVQNQNSYKFTQFQEYATLVSKQTKNRIDQQVHQVLLNLQGKLKNFQFQDKKNEKERQLGYKDEQKTEQKDKKNEKTTEPVTFQLCKKEFEQIKIEFVKIWKQEYFLMMNYRIAIAAKQIERWTQIANHKVSKDQISKEISEFFI